MVEQLDGVKRKGDRGDIRERGSEQREWKDELGRGTTVGREYT